jgi:hypothetical protein
LPLMLSSQEYDLTKVYRTNTMQIKFIKLQDTLYKTVGTQHAGFDVYKQEQGRSNYMGRSHCDTPRMAVNDVVARQYRRYY